MKFIKTILSNNSVILFILRASAIFVSVFNEKVYCNFDYTFDGGGGFGGGQEETL